MIYLFILTISFITVFLATPPIRSLALKLYVVDRKNHRKIHKKVITKLGGLAISLGFLSGLIVIGVFNPYFFRAYTTQISGLIVCSTLILMLGIYDDFQGSNALTKFTVQIIVSLLLIKIGFRLERVFIPGLIDISLGKLGRPLTLLWLVGITNAINLIDGLDGLAAGIIAIASLFLCLCGFLVNESFVVYISLALLGASLGFLNYNFYPAKIFMGDSGSLFLGFVIGCLGVYCFQAQGLGNLIFVPTVLVLLLPILDATLAIARRIIRRKHIFRGDFSHIHHYYIKLGFSQAHVAIRFYIITFFLGVVSLLVFSITIS